MREAWHKSIISDAEPGHGGFLFFFCKNYVHTLMTYREPGRGAVACDECHIYTKHTQTIRCRTPGNELNSGSQRAFI